MIHKMLHARINLKPLSANRMFARKGKTTFKSKDYTIYQETIQNQLQGTEWPFGTDRVHFHVEAGLSNRGADLDNVIKPILDTYQWIYEDFNDNKVYGIELEKYIVKRGSEYLDIRVREYEDDQTEPTVMQEESKSETKDESVS